MLVLTRRINEEIIIDGNIRITITAINGDKVRIGVSAPDSVRVDRAEVHARRAEPDSDTPLIVKLPDELPVAIAKRSRRIVPRPPSQRTR